MPLPVIAGLLARAGAVLSRVLPALGRAAPAAAEAVAPAPVPGMAAAGRAAAATNPGRMAAQAAASPSTQTTVNLQLPQNVGPAPTGARWRGAPPPSSVMPQPAATQPAASAPSAPAAPASPQWPTGPMAQAAARTVAAQQAAQATAQAATQAGQQASFQTAGRNAQSATQRLFQRGAQLYQQAAPVQAHERKRERQRDFIDFHQSLGAGMEAAKNFDPKAMEHWGKAAGIGFKYIAAIILGPLGVAAALAVLPKKLRDFANSLLESRRPLAELHGGQAATFARLDVERMSRNVRFAGMTSGSTEALARATSDLEERLLPYAAAAVNILQRILTAVERTVIFYDTLLRYAAKVDPQLAMIVKLLDLMAKDDTAASGNLSQLALDIRDGKYNTRSKPPMPKHGAPPAPAAPGRKP